MRSGYGDLAIGETGADLHGQLAERGGVDGLEAAWLDRRRFLSRA
jgi:hypothetical protein